MLANLGYLALSAAMFAVSVTMEGYIKTNNVIWLAIKIAGNLVATYTSDQKIATVNVLVQILTTFQDITNDYCFDQDWKWIGLQGCHKLIAMSSLQMVWSIISYKANNQTTVYEPLAKSSSEET